MGEVEHSVGQKPGDGSTPQIQRRIHELQKKDMERKLFSTLARSFLWAGWQDTQIEDTVGRTDSCFAVKVEGDRLGQELAVGSDAKRLAEVLDVGAVVQRTVEEEPQIGGHQMMG